MGYPLSWNNLIISATSAITNKIWIRLPPTLRLKPRSQRITNTPIIVQIMFFILTNKRNLVSIQDPKFAKTAMYLYCYSVLCPTCNK